MTTTRTTPWAAGFSDLPMAAGNTFVEVVGAVLSDLSERLDCGYLEPDDVDGESITVYRDVVWCVGGDGEDCDCGQSHRDADAPWLVMSCGWRRKPLVQVIRPTTDDGDFDVQIVGEDRP